MSLAKCLPSGRRRSRFRLAAVCIACCLLPWPLQAALRVTDDSGLQVELATPARRIVSLAPHITELLFAAGAGGALVGVSEFSDAPVAARSLPRIGGGGGLDLERIVALQPDLIVAWQSGNPAFQVQRLRELGFAVFVSEPRELGAIPATIARLAHLAGTEAAAHAAITDFTRRLDGLRERYRGRAPVRVFYQVWDRPLMTVGGRHLVSAVMHLCGGSNIFADLPQLAPQVGIEAVLQRDPQAIVVAAAGDEAGRLLALWRQWPQLPAVRHGQLHAIDRELLVRHTPRILDGAERLCRILDQVRAGQSQRQ